AMPPCQHVPRGLRLIRLCCSTVTAMEDTLARDICKEEVDRFLLEKHLATCPVCGRFRSKCDVDVHTLSGQRICAEGAAPKAEISIAMVVCQNCGAIQCHDRAIVARWIERQRNPVG